MFLAESIDWNIALTKKWNILWNINLIFPRAQWFLLSPMKRANQAHKEYEKEQPE